MYYTDTNNIQSPFSVHAYFLHPSDTPNLLQKTLMFNISTCLIDFDYKVQERRNESL